MATIYANENFPLRVVMELRAMGHNVLTSQDAGRANQMVPDDEVLSFATQEGRAVLTLNRRDFFRLHQATAGKHAGIIACTRDEADPVAFARRIHEAVERSESLAGRVIRVVRPSS